MLSVLAKRPDRRVSFAEISREAGQVLEPGNRAERARYSELATLTFCRQA